MVHRVTQDHQIRLKAKVLAFWRRDESGQGYVTEGMHSKLLVVKNVLVS